MIVSMATVVLPVLRSPMISSRWPRPTGVIASMALMPVCSGSCTGLRPMMPGAWISMRRSATLVSAPPPSIGLPRASTTRPSRPSPTGTDRMRPVALTAWPSLTSAASPSTTAPIDSSSRLRARPTSPLSNSSSSLTAALWQPRHGGDAVAHLGDAPDLRRLDAGLEVLEVLAERSGDVCGVDGQLCHRMCPRPRCFGYARRSSSWSSRVRTEPSMTVSPDLGDDAAQHRRVDDDLDLDLLAGGVAQRLGQPRPLVVGRADGRAHLGDLLVGLGRAHLHELADDGGQVAGAARAHHHRDQGDGGGRRLAAQQVLHDLLAPAGRDGRVGERVAQLVGPLQGLREAEQLVLDLAEGALGPGDPEQGLGVGERAVVCHLGVAPTWRTWWAWARPLRSAAPPPG